MLLPRVETALNVAIMVGMSVVQLWGAWRASTWSCSILLTVFYSNRWVPFHAHWCSWLCSSRFVRSCHSVLLPVNVVCKAHRLKGWLGKVSLMLFSRRMLNTTESRYFWRVNAVVWKNFFHLVVDWVLLRFLSFWIALWWFERDPLRFWISARHALTSNPSCKTLSKLFL